LPVRADKQAGQFLQEFFKAVRSDFKKSWDSSIVAKFKELLASKGST